ncbi:catalase HPII, partial [Klebsiella pneumoniae]|nr:catalase HPII [Klebsiella pneumoniae]
VEFDAVLVASDPLPGPDAAQGLDAKAAAPSPQEVDPRASLLLQEVWRQAKPMGAWGTGIDTLGALGMADGAGVTVAQTPQGVLT